MHKFLLIAIIAFAIVLTPAQALPAVPALHGFLHTKDNMSIAYDHYKSGFDSVIIICPGFFNSKENRWMRKSVDIVYPKYDVIIFDFRGHGESSGRYTWSTKESMDIDAVIDYAKSQKYKHIGILAFSLGAAAAVNVASQREDIDSMVLISCPCKFSMIEYYFWEPAAFSDLKDNIDCKWVGKGARVSNLFLRKDDPIDSIGKINKTAILFIQGRMDWVIKERHAEKLYNATNTSKTKRLELVDSGLHAERLIQQYPEKMAKLILEWFTETL